MSTRFRFRHAHQLPMSCPLGSVRRDRAVRQGERQRGRAVAQAAAYGVLLYNHARLSR
jgi:hypothetical protein